MKNIKILILVGVSGIFNSCVDYLDVVPDNVATIDNAFTSRSMAEKFLFTCYSYMPSHSSINTQAFTIGDEFWVPYPQVPLFFYNDPFEQIAMGNQGIINPQLNYWDGANNGKAMFIALRDCNIFLEKVNGVPGLYEQERKRWIAEVKFLKAYYHYWLLRMYGPVPLIRENLPVSASVEEVQVKREPVDACFDYIVSLLNEAVADLPLKLQNESTEMGRATQPVVLAVKAKVLVEAASPLFNGNTDYANFKDKDGIPYFNQAYDVAKWEKAATACRNAIDTCHLAGFALYQYQQGVGENMVPEIVTQMSIRNSVAENNYTLNKEAVWTNPNSTSYEIQSVTTPFIDPSKITNMGIRPILAPPLRIAEMFYTASGVPVDEDQEWESNGKYAERYKVKTATDADKYHIKVGVQTATLHFDREIRFYANLSFDGGLWYGTGKFDNDDQWDVRAKAGEAAGKRSMSRYSVTGYFCKKLANYKNVILPGDGGGYQVVDYPWPVIRLADLYLLCSEALNEAYGPSQEAYQWIDLVRSRAGLEGVEASWSKYARTSRKAKPTTQDGLRDIIQRERLIELANEGQRYWEIRRWKRAKEIWHNKPIQGWDIEQSETATYYRVRNIYTPQFTTKNYLWPVREYNLSVNPNLDQNPGW
ncbi:MAG: RagB/SusD family nutrient uptake outer membrane protein [Bacteroidales bacterium]|nr:RagB/SusD family nutrient uptake outer membrane protein [Bacteroidales bacterium]